ncbi:hypothetical protein BCY91_06820 [Pelobium manganitolerans]|uniref:Uncharacterized protein n=1 Tax=Pelobium manganitolerans TaxID=1842495 RepID=A0A419S533_9SPHI|nr:hypothetical protein [Pelobium manganitolerans]RKD15218.1 hypothetical protein BCY91_06820 [Pelobium manganitolerans]
MKQQQKYNNGQSLYYIDYTGYEVFRAKITVYEPSTFLYKINFKVSGTDLVMIADVPEQSLITLEELMTNRNSVNTNLPEGFKDESVGTLLFVSAGEIYVGTLNFDKNWKDYKTGNYVDDVTHWMHVEGFPDTEFGSARFYDEGELTDEPQ